MITSFTRIMQAAAHDVLLADDPELVQTIRNLQACALTPAQIRRTITGVENNLFSMYVEQTAIHLTPH